MIKISIIIPVYNASEYLENCVGSILRQSYSHFEIILVDDGSTDESGSVCDRLSKDDERIITVHTENGGTSAARNVGVKRATGDYITFVDNDDYWMTDTCLEDVVRHLELSNADLLMHTNREYDVVKGRLSPSPTKLIQDITDGLNAEETILRVIENGLMTRAVWNKVVKTSLLNEHGIDFPEAMRNEDTDWTASVLEIAQNVVWHDDAFYVYRVGHEYAQTSKILKPKEVFDLAEVIERHLHRMREIPMSASRQECCLQYLAYPYMVWMGQSTVVGLLPASDELSKRMQSYASLLEHHLDPTVNKVYLAYRVLGFNLTSKLLGAALKRKYPSVA